MLGKYRSGDKSFLRLHREKIQDYFLRATKKHCNNVVNLKALYCVICILILEVPCGFSAAMATCIAMTMQDFALNDSVMAGTSRYWVHCIVISIMSLICWVHKAPVLYNYVNQIIYRRAKDAPQLNPPLKPVYYMRHHQTTWNKPCLFLEDWELRYALWKHFQGHAVSKWRLLHYTRFYLAHNAHSCLSYISSLIIGLNNLETKLCAMLNTFHSELRNKLSGILISVRC